MPSRLLGISLVLPFLLAWKASASEPAPRGTADVEDRGGWSVGVFSPLRLAVADGIEVELHPLVALAAPHLKLRARHGRLGPFRLAGAYGLMVPTPAMRLLKGTLFPGWEMTEREIPWFIVPSAALLASIGDSAVTTLRASVAAGIPLGDNHTIPLDGYAPLDLLLAPMLQGFAVRAGVGHDRPLAWNMRVRGGVDVWLVGESPDPPRSPLFVSARIGVDLGLGESMRLTAGAVWFNSDQRRTTIETTEDGFSERRARRTNDFFPTLDLIWEG